MKPSLRPPKTPATLSDSLNRQLNLYALAAGAAGIGMLALTQVAQAKIVYTPTHKVLPPGGTVIDFNHDGINDLTLLRYVRGYGFSGTDLWAYGNFVSHSLHGVDDLKAGFRVGKNDRFGSIDGIMASVSRHSNHRTSFRGNWANDGKGVKNRYVGVRFEISGEVHYGWARLNVTFPKQRLRAVLTGYAYETIPSKAIITGKIMGAGDSGVTPATLGRLALGRK